MSKFYNERKAQTVVRAKLSRLGEFLWRIKTFDVYCNETYRTQLIANRWHPVAWVVVLVSVIASLISPLWSCETLKDSLTVMVEAIKEFCSGKPKAGYHKVPCPKRKRR